MTDETWSENGKTLFQSAENLRKASLDLDAMCESLWEITFDAKFAGGFVKNAPKEDDNWETDWIIPIYTGNGEVRASGKGSRRLGTITYVVRLCGSEDPAEGPSDWPWLDQACLFVGWHRSDKYWTPEDFEPSKAETIRHLDAGLWARHDGGGARGFFFVLPLFALRDEGDLKQFILKPLQALFGEDNPVNAAKGAFKGVPVLQPGPG